MTTLTEPLATLSAPIEIDDLSDEPLAQSIDVNDTDRAALAERLDLPGIKALTGSLSAVRHGSLIHIAGHLDAELERTCVVSLEAMTETISEDFSTDYTTEVAEGVDGEDSEGDLDAPEPLDGEVLDLGDVLLEQLVLAMNPHPRKEGAEAPNDPGAGQESSPFDVLKALKS